MKHVTAFSILYFIGSVLITLLHSQAIYRKWSGGLCWEESPTPYWLSAETIPASTHDSEILFEIGQRYCRKALNSCLIIMHNIAVNLFVACHHAVNGRVTNVGLKNQSREEVLEWVHRARGVSGAKVRLFCIEYIRYHLCFLLYVIVIFFKQVRAFPKWVLTKNPSIQGPWNPFTNA